MTPLSQFSDAVYQAALAQLQADRCDVVFTIRNYGAAPITLTCDGRETITLPPLPFATPAAPAPAAEGR